jgi:hypothetical protein
MGKRDSVTLVHNKAGQEVLMAADLHSGRLREFA